ncbi:hypothetical protein G7054_g4536 [Neopestalotiopsis clavispora]|nr:hypothetical protein G7054_g4536 [Neopestalotiopsis clavispora]
MSYAQGQDGHFYHNTTDETATTSPKAKVITIARQDIGDHAKVQIGDQYFMRRASTFDRDRDEILNWISPLLPHQTHDRVRQTALIDDQSELCKAHSPGKWLLESELFDRWQSSEIRKLWYFGMQSAGAGKTVLTSVIIDHLLSLNISPKEENDRSVAFLYLSYKDPQTLETLVGSVIRQLVERIYPLPKDIRELWKLRKSNDHPPLGELSSLLRKLSEDRNIYLVIDAFDECPKDIRFRLFKALQTDTERIHTLVTSRYLEEFDTLFEDFQRRNPGEY